MRHKFPRYFVHGPMLAIALSYVYWGFEATVGRAQERKTGLSLRELTEQKRDQGKLPALWLAVVPKSGEPQIAVSGVRKWGAAPVATIKDKIHLGSCTKAMTAFVVARLVDEQKLKWDSTLDELLPSLATQVHADFRKVTVAELLSHRSGVAANPQDWWHKSGNTHLNQVRTEIAISNLSAAANHPRQEFLYSNLGYMLAGLMISEVTNSSWEKQIERRLFQPLKIKTAGFGAPGTPNRTDQPWGHLVRGNSWKPVQQDNAAALGPAGTVHLSIGDWAKFIQVFLNQDSRGLLKPQTYQRLLEPAERAKDGYALGWSIAHRDWGQGQVLNHSGSNTSWYCTVWVAPELGRAYIVATNSCAPESNKLLDGFVSDLIQWDQTTNPAVSPATGRR